MPAFKAFSDKERQVAIATADIMRPNVRPFSPLVSAMNGRVVQTVLELTCGRSRRTTGERSHLDVVFLNLAATRRRFSSKWVKEFSLNYGAGTLSCTIPR